MPSQSPLFLLLLLLLTDPSSASSDPFLELKSTAPAILDSPIRFEVVIRGAEHLRGPFVFRWNDNASPAHWKEETSQDRSANLTLVYSSKEYEADDYTMTVKTFKFVGPFREEVASADLGFKITKELNGQISINGVFQSAASKAMVVSTTNTTKLSVTMYDPTHYLAGAQLSYYWFINETNFGLSNDPSFSYEFVKPGHSSVEVTVLAYFTNDSASIDQQSFLRNRHSSLISPPGVKFGLFRSKLESRVPLQNVNISGSTWLKHGELLDLGVSCDGSGPWQYCWSLKGPDYNVTGNETCVDPGTMSSECAFPVMWYFRQAGTFDILLQVSNALAVQRKLIHVNIYEVHSQPPIMVVVGPIVSAVLGVMICASGIYTYYMFKRNLSVEIADFDFNPQEEQLEFKTFWERLRDSMANAFQSSSDTISHVSSVSSRSAQQNAGGGIHYGSIP